jgi:hypothetical protein
MALSKHTKAYLDSQIDYYISEAQAYREIAEQYVPEIESVIDAAFGIVAGCVYSSFVQSYTSHRQTPSLEDIQEFNRILKDRAPLIKKAMMKK